MKYFLLFLVSLSFTCHVNGQYLTVNYAESSEDFPNPDRGFYHPSNGVASSFTALDATQLANLRNNSFTPWLATYDVKTTVVFRHYILDSYVNTDEIPLSFLALIQADMDAARTAGVRLLLRFSYTITPTAGDCGSWICPPYGDAPKARVLGHIAQLAPLFQVNEDVILALQSGFIGTWGEQYYTDHFGDVSLQGFLSDENWADRLEVIDALLDAMPASRMVLVRYPQLKQKMIYGIAAPVSSLPMTSAQAFSTEDIARIGFHNDCFLSASDDQGTYWDYGSSSSSASNQTGILKPYSQLDGEFVLVGGETCSDAYSPENNCASENGNAVNEMDELNYTFLNSDYNNEVNNDWQSGGCMDEIKRRLGYRYRLVEGTYPTSSSSGAEIDLAITIENDGFTANMLAKELVLILRNTITLDEFELPLDDDSRYWAPGSTITVNSTLTLPAGMPDGDYSLFLHLRDSSASATLAVRADYSVQLANLNVWEAATGYNSLLHQLTITNTCLGDFDGDKSINTNDLSLFLAGFGCSADCSVDLNNDGMVAVDDLGMFLSLFGNSCF